MFTPKQWVEATGAIGIASKSGRYGGTYAHTDIAFEMFSIFFGFNYSVNIFWIQLLLTKWNQ